MINKFLPTEIKPYRSLKVMLTLVFFYISFFQVDAKGFSQKTRITIKLQNASMREAFTKIEAQTNYKFFYKPDEIDLGRTINLTAKNRLLSDVLNDIFQGTNIQYKTLNKQILVYPGPNKTEIKSGAEKTIEKKPIDRIINGTINDKTGQGLPGASIMVKDSDIGTLSNADGTFTLTVPDGNVTLVATYIGYLRQEYNLSSAANNITITLLEDEANLDEIVVVAYGTESKKLLTSSMATLNTDEISDIPTAQLSTSLAGRLPGAQIVQNSGFTGGGASIRIRGSIVDPLYVIDNVISDKAQFDVLDPNEVATISVLKDAASASIYGSRASGGVVLVTTKSGKSSQKVIVNYTGIFTTNRTTKPLQNWTPEQELIHRNNLAYNNNLASANPNPNFTLPFDADALAYSKTLRYRNINDEIWRNPVSQQHSINASGGSDKITYFFGGNFNKNKGSYENVEFDKYTLRSKVDAQISKNLRIGTNISFNRRDTDRFFWPYDYDNGEGFTVADFYRPTFNLSRLYPFYTTSDGVATNADDPNAFPVIQPGWGFNPVEVIRSKNYRNILYNTFNSIITADLDLPFVPGLSLSFLGNYRQDSKFQKDFVGEFNKSYRIQTQASSGIGLIQLAPIDFKNVVTNNLGRSYPGITENFQNSERYQLNGFIKYNNTFGVHGIDGLLGIERYQFKGVYASGNANNSITPSNDQILSTGTGTEYRYFNGSEELGARLSYFGRLRYVLMQRYILELSFREDGSYLFPKGKRFGFFPSVSGAWRISEEDFFTVDAINELKIKASYGTTGSDAINPFQFQNNYILNGNYVFGNGILNGLSPQNSVPNPNITWSVMKTFNFGFDIGLFQNKLNSTFNYFTARESKILAPPTSTIPGTFGTNLSSSNVGERSLSGFELSVDFTDNVGGFTYTVGGNMGYARDKWLKWPQAAGIQDFQSIVGKPSGFIVGYKSLGIVRDQAELDKLPENFTEFGRKLQLGEILFEDIRGDGYSNGPDGKIDGNDQQVISLNSIPRINFGLFSNLSWNNFSLDAFFQGVAKYDKIVSTKNTTTGGVFQLNDRPYFALWTDAYSPSNPNGKYPRVQGWGQIENGQGPSTFWIRNGAYFRLKNLNFAYRIPQNLTRNIGFSNIQVYFNATNLFTISAFKEYDPEQQSLDSYPLFKSYSFGLNLSF